MINFLRNEKIPSFKDNNEEINFHEELQFWQIPINDNCKIKNLNFFLLFLFCLCDFYDIILVSNSLSRQTQQFDPDWCADTLECIQNNKVIRKHGNYK